MDECVYDLRVLSDFGEWEGKLDLREFEFEIVRNREGNFEKLTWDLTGHVTTKVLPNESCPESLALYSDKPQEVVTTSDLTGPRVVLTSRLGQQSTNLVLFGTNNSSSKFWFQTKFLILITYTYQHT
ncbi:hypothetical protein HAX54_047733, partial [Datura stramonium]|nr:hypothetical protein [Datura stramonium]